MTHRPLHGMSLKVKGFLLSEATFSDCEKFRYTLHRRWALGGDLVAFIGVNPSTATADVSDNTVTRCINYAKAWGYSGMFMLNLNAYRATDPLVMKARALAGFDVVGPDNDEAIADTIKKVQRIVCAWGVHGQFQDRDAAVLRGPLRNRELFTLGLTKGGIPLHPLYLRKSLKPTPWWPHA